MSAQDRGEPGERPKETPAPSWGGSTTTRLKRALIGKPRDFLDPRTYHTISLIALLAWVGLGADGLYSSSYGPDEAFRALGEHTYLAVLLALATAITVVIISFAYARIIERFPFGGGGYALATHLLGARLGVVSGSALLVDYVDQVARHGLIDMDIEAHGDLHIDAHHTVEDIGITLGKAFAQAVGDKKGIYRYGHSYVPLDEALSRVVIDFSGRPGLFYDVKYPKAMIGSFDVDLFREFFQGFVNHAGVTLHIDSLKGANAHHVAETIFKALGRAIRMAITADSRMAGIMPSTIGSL